jgi:hypothetical protein
MREPPKRRYTLHRGTLRAAACGVAVLMAAPAARAETALPGIAGLGTRPRMADAFDRHSGIVSLPSWVGLVSGADQARAGRLTEGIGANGRLALSFGHSTGLAAPAAGVLAPAVNPVERRMANLRSARRLAGSATLGVRAAMAETRETALDTPGIGATFGERHQRSVGTGATLDLFGRRLTLDGEIAGAQTHDRLTDANPDGRTGVGRRLGAILSPVRVGGMEIGATVWHGQAGAGYAAPGGIAADWRESGVGTNLAAGPLVFVLNAVRRGNNLERDPVVLTLSEQTVSPSLGLSLDRWRAHPDGRIRPALLLPSALRVSAAAGRTVGRPAAGGPFTAADATDVHRRSGTLALDWTGQRSTTTLALSTGLTDSRQPGKESADGVDRSLSLTHAIARPDTAFTVALALRRSEHDKTADRSKIDGINLAASLTHRGGPLGTMVTSLAIDRARNDALDAAGIDIDTSWQARAAFDLGILPDETDGRLSLALALKGNDPDREEDLRSVEMVVGLAGRLRF